MTLKLIQSADFVLGAKLLKVKQHLQETLVQALNLWVGIKAFGKCIGTKKYYLQVSVKVNFPQEKYGVLEMKELSERYEVIINCYRCRVILLQSLKILT